MAITKETYLDLVEVVFNKDSVATHIQYREVTEIYEDDNLLTKSYHRSTLEPSADLTGMDESLVAIANAIW